MSSVSIPRRGPRVPVTADVKRTVEAALERLRNQEFVASDTSELKDYVVPKGVIGRAITYRITERVEGR